MAFYLETIKTTADNSTAEIAKYPDEMTAAIFYHAALNTNIRLVQSGELKAFYANIHNDNGLTFRQERWENDVEEPTA